MAIKRRKSVKFQFPDFMLIILIIFSSVMLAFSSGSFVVNFKTVGFNIVSSVQKNFFVVTNSVKNTFTAVSELAKVKKERDELLKKLDTYEQMRRSNTVIQKENERLREQLGFSTSLEEKNYPAQIIARDTDNLYAYLTINKGSAVGIRKNMPVIAYQNGNTGLVGRVVQVGKFTSIIMPVYNLNCSISARIQNTRDLGLVSGNGNQNGTLNMKYIKSRVKESLHIGDVVVTSGENNNYMRDLVLGTVSKVTEIKYNSSLDIELIPIIDFSRLENVIVVNMREINDKMDR